MNVEIFQPTDWQQLRDQFEKSGSGCRQSDFFHHLLGGKLKSSTCGEPPFSEQPIISLSNEKNSKMLEDKISEGNVIWTSFFLSEDFGSICFGHDVKSGCKSSRWFYNTDYGDRIAIAFDGATKPARKLSIWNLRVAGIILIFISRSIWYPESVNHCTIGLLSNQTLLLVIPVGMCSYKVCNRSSVV